MRRIFVFALLSAALVLPPSAVSRDVLVVTTSWELPNQQILLIDPEFGHVRVVWHNRENIHDAMLSPDGARLYVTYYCRPAHCLSVVDTSTGEVIRTVETPGFSRRIMPAGPAMAISPDGGRLYLLETNYDQGSHDFFLRTFETGPGLLLPQRQGVTECSGARILAFGAEKDPLLLCHREQPSAGDDPKFLMSFASGVQGVLSRGKLYVAEQSGRVLEIDPVTREVLRSAEEPSLANLMPASGNLSAGSGLWYLPLRTRKNEGGEVKQILVFDINTMRPVATITTKQPFWSLALSSDGAELYATIPEDNSIAVIDTTTHDEVRALLVGAKPSFIQVAPAP